MFLLVRRSHRLCLSWIACLPAIAGAGFPALGEKVAHPLPSAEDVKTPAPLASSGPSRIPAPTLRPSATLSRPSGAPAGSGAATASSGPKPAPPDARARDRRFERVQVAEPGDGAIWARGRQYKARFAADGVTFVPFFGSKAETNHPVRFSLAAARIGADELEIDASAAPELSADLVEFERGQVVERWNLTVDAIEQQFVIESLAPTGDLVLEIAVETDLTAAEQHGALSFGCALGRVEYGAAVAIDAAGRRFPLASTWTGTTIDLRLDRAALQTARFPLGIDPVVSTTTFDSSLADDHAPDTAYEASSNSYLVVYEEDYSATDHDVYALQLDANGTPLFGGYLDYTTDDWRRPKVASNALGQNFLCVAAVRPVAGGLRAIRGATFAAATSTPGPQFTISGTESGDKVNPDVGGDPALAAPTYYFVVWQRNYSVTDEDVHARLVNGNGTTASGLILVDNSTGTIDTVPAISKSDGRPPYNTQNWTIAWQRRDTFTGEERIWGAQHLWDGSVTHATFPIDQGDDCLAPTVSSLLDFGGFERTYMVAFQVRGQQQVDWDVIGAVFEGTQFQTGTDIGNQISLVTLPDDQIRPRVDSDGWHFTVTWAQEYAGGFADWDIFVADLVYAGGYPYVASWDTFAYTSLQELAPAITSTYSGGGARRRYLAAWDVLDQFTPGAVRDVWTGLWDGGEGGFAEPFCFGDGTANACPCSNFGSAGNGCANSVNANGANLAYAGNPWVGNDTFTLLGSGMPDTATLYFQGTGPAGMWSGVVFGDGLRCVTGSTIRLGAKLNVGGASQVPEAGDPTISSHLIMPSTGVEYFYQAWYRNAAAYCTTSTFNLTNGLNAVWAP
ncbi:MAG: hypothetical protein NTY35_02145 [Planctomycetota bacterium]|nr:hypothetical protein [Planctomycetota bacterium]